MRESIFSRGFFLRIFLSSRASHFAYRCLASRVESYLARLDFLFLRVSSMIFWVLDLVSEISVLLVCVLVRDCLSRYSMMASPSRCARFEDAFLCHKTKPPFIPPFQRDAEHLHDVHFCIVFPCFLIYSEENVHSVILVLV